MTIRWQRNTTLRVDLYFIWYGTSSLRHTQLPSLESDAILEAVLLCVSYRTEAFTQCAVLRGCSNIDVRKCSEIRRLSAFKKLLIKKTQDYWQNVSWLYSIFRFERQLMSILLNLQCRSWRSEVAVGHSLSDDHLLQSGGALSHCIMCVHYSTCTYLFAFYT